MATADRQDASQGRTSHADGRPPQGRMKRLFATWGRPLRVNPGLRGGTMGPVVLALAGLGLVAGFLAITSPGNSITDVANLNVTVDAPPGAVTSANASVEAHLTRDGGASVAVEVYFVCQASATTTIELSSLEARRVEYAPESPGPRLSDSLLSSPTVNRVDHGIQVSGECGRASAVNIPLSVEFPAGTVAAQLESGRYAFGLDLFIANQSNVLGSNSHAIGLQTPEGALLTDAFDATSRTFNRATWAAESEFGLPAYGTYSVPEQVARARWWENVILLLLGAGVGIAVEAALRRLRADRRR